MPRQILYQVNQLTSGESAAGQIERLRRHGAQGLEFCLPNVIGETEAIEPNLTPSLDGLTALCPDLPILAAGMTCELMGGDSFAQFVSGALAVCASRGVKTLNLSIERATAATAAESALRYGEAAHIVYAVLRDLRNEIESSGVMLNVASGAYGLLLSPLEMRQMIDATNSWAIGACVDVAQVSTFSRPADWITCLGSRIRAVRLPKGNHRPGHPSSELGLSSSFEGMVIM